MATIEPIKVEGLDEFRRALRDMDSSAGPALRKALNRSGEVIVSDTPPWMPRKTGRARASVRMRSTQREARVMEGGARAPHVPWLDFGGTRPDGGSRPFRKTGRFIHTTYGKKQGVIAEGLQAELVGLAEAAGLEVRSE